MNAAVPKVLELRIPADARYIAVVRRGVRNLAESAGFARDEVADVEVAVCEAVTNSVTHGCPEDDAGAVFVKCSAGADSLVVEIEDEGKGESLPSCPPACDPADERGRGMLMMRALMDEWETTRTDNGARVRMAKQRAH